MSAWKGLHPTRGAAPSRAPQPSGILCSALCLWVLAPFQSVPKQSVSGSGGHAAGFVFFFLWVRMTSSTAQPGIFGAANPKKQQEPLLELRSTTQNSRKGFPKEEFLKNKGFLSFNCKRSSGLHHQRELRWNGSSKRSWERNGASRGTSEPHALLRAGCRC